MNTGKKLLSFVVISAVAVTFYMITDDRGGATSIQSITQHGPGDPVPAENPESIGNADGDADKNDIEAEILADLEFLALPKDLEREIASLEQELEQMNPEAPVSPWTISPVIPTDAIELDEKIQTREPVSMDAAQAADVAVGDIISLPLPGTALYQAVVDRVSVRDSGETSWSGYLQGFDTDYPVVFTIGAQSSFATITTPEGLYTMEAVNGNGWVYKTPDLIDLVDPDQPDHLITDNNGHIE